MRPSGISEIILEKALHFLTEWENGIVTLDDCLDTLRRENGPERGAVASLLFEYFRHKGFVDSIIEKNARKGRIHQPMRLLLCCAVTQLFFQTGLSQQSAVNIAVDHAKVMNGQGGGSFVNAMLRSILRDKSFDPANIPPSFPPRLEKRWICRMGKEQTESVTKYFASNPPLSFRVRKDVLQETLDSIHAVPVAGLDFTGSFRFYETNDPAALFESRLLDDASIYIQDPATALFRSLPDQPLTGRILDACAAPGGKTILMADSSEPSQTLFFAADRSPRRTILLNRNLHCAGVRCRTVTADAASLAYSKGSFDVILADVPCSNTGVIRRRPDAPWRFTEKSLAETVELQKHILENLSGFVKPGGILIYSTCSIEQEEDQDQMASFLVSHGDFELVKDRLLLPGDHHDGAYAALLHRLS